MLILGDPFNKGHEKVEKIKLDSNLTLEEIEKAYQKGSQLIGVDVITQMFNSYDNNKISAILLNKLYKFGFSLSSLKKELFKKMDNVEIQLIKSDFVDIVLFVVKLGNNNFNYKLIENKEWYIGGYGFFL